MRSLCPLPLAKKPQFWANFGIWEGYRTDPLLPMKVKFGVLEETQGLYLHAKFHLNVFIVSASGGQKPQLWGILTFWRLLYRPLLPMRAKFGVQKQTRGIRLRTKFRLDRFILWNSVGENPHFCGFLDFGI